MFVVIAVIVVLLFLLPLPLRLLLLLLWLCFFLLLLLSCTMLRMMKKLDPDCAGLGESTETTLRIASPKPSTLNPKP